MKKSVCVLVMVLNMFGSFACSAMSHETEPRIEDFAGFPNESSEPFYYVREYPYASLFVIAAAVGGIIYYNRAHVKKKVRQLLHLVQGEVEREEKEEPAV